MMKRSLISISFFAIIAFAAFSPTNVHGGVRSSDFAFSLGIRDSFMIAHSFHNHPSFGPAGKLHGATYTCDVEFGCNELNSETAWVIDIGLASDILATVLKKYNFQNLDDLFGDKILTTTEFMCQQIHQDLKEQLKQQCPDFHGEICVKLFESHKAWASYTAEV